MIIVHLEVQEDPDGGILCGRLESPFFMLVTLDGTTPRPQDPRQRICKTCLRIWKREHYGD